MNKKLLNRIAILGFGVAFLGSCGDFIDNLVTTEWVNEGDTRACITYQSGKYSERRYCDEKRNYPAQVKNLDADRFQAASYTPNSPSAGLEGLWLMLAELPPLGKVRQTCLMQATANANEYQFNCTDASPLNPLLTENSNTIENTNAVTYSITNNGSTTNVTLNFSGTITNNNLVAGTLTGTKFVDGGAGQSFTDNDFALVKVADSAVAIGSFSASKKAFADASVLASINHDVHGFFEAEGTKELNAYDVNGDNIANVKTNYSVTNNQVLQDYNLSNKGIMFAGQEQVLDVTGSINSQKSWQKQKTRQLDFTPLGSENITIELLSNRLQSTMFERPDTEATLTVSF